MRPGFHTYAATAFKAVNETLPHGLMMATLRLVTSMPAWISKPVANLSSAPTAAQLKYVHPAEGGAWLKHPDDTEKDADVVLFYIHGGVYVLGNALMHPDLFVAFIDAMRERKIVARIFSVEYSLAPAQHPTQLNECVAAYQILSQQVPPEKIVIGGDSIGAALVLATLFQLDAAGTPLPGKTLLLSPWVDIDPAKLAASPSYAENKGHDFMDLPFVRRGVQAVVPDPSMYTDPCVSPLYASDEQLRKVPGGYIAYGTREVLRSSAEAMIERLKGNGKAWSVDAQPGSHEWMCSATYSGDAHMCQAGVQRLVNWLCNDAQLRHVSEVAAR